VECDPLNEAPMMALAVRQAWRNGAQVYRIGNACPPDTAQEPLYETQPITTMADIPFRDARQPVIICGTHQADLPAIADAVQSGAKLACILDSPNAFGCALLSKEHGAVPFSQALASGRIKGLIACEADLPTEMTQGITLLAVVDWLNTPLMSRAEVALPATAWVEMEGTFINNEGRAQRFKQVMQPGLPIKGLDPAGHPPRIHRKTPPGGDLRPAWQVLAELLERLGGEKADHPLGGPWEKLRGLDAEGQGLSLLKDKA